MTRKLSLIAALVASALNLNPALAQSSLGAQNQCDWKQDMNQTGALAQARALASVTALADGRVLVAGGSGSSNANATAELFDPRTGIFSTVGSMNTPRYAHAAVRLLSGQLLLAGGSYGGWNGGALSGSELFDPASQRFTPTGSMARERLQPSLLLLQSGEVLAIGGMDRSGNPVGEIELYDPAAQAWRVIGRLQKARMLASATQRLQSVGIDEIVVAGGSDGGQALDSIAIYEAQAGGVLRLKAMEQLLLARQEHSATRLLDGRILISGGSNGRNTEYSELEIIGPSGLPWAVGQLAAARSGHAATLLATGQVLFSGGYAKGSGVAEVELFDDIGVWGTRSIGRLQEPRFNAGAAELPFGQALIVGGFVGLGVQLSKTTELYDPFWGGVGPMEQARSGHSATLLSSGRLLLAGGWGSGGITTGRGEVFETATGQTWFSRPMAKARTEHQAVRLASGEVLLTGGVPFPGGVALRDAELFDLRTAAFRATTPMELPRTAHAMALLPGGEVMVAGGVASQTWDSSERYRYDPISGSGSFRTDARMPAPRHGQSAALLASGQLLTAGGSDGSGTIWKDVASYDPSSSSWSGQAPLQTARSGAPALALANGQMLVAGGLTWGRQPTASFELAPGGAQGQMAKPRVAHALTGSQRSSSEAWVVGGRDAFVGGALESVERLDTSTMSSQPLPGLGVPRDRHSATLMGDGRVLVAGGMVGGGPSATVLLSKPSHCKPVRPVKYTWNWPAVTVFPWKTWPGLCTKDGNCK